MSRSSSEKSSFDRLLDAAVYAPLGFVLTREKTGTDLAQAGRKQVAFTRSLGRAALQGLARARAGSPDPETTASRTDGVRPSGRASDMTDQPVVAPTDPTPIEGYEMMTAREVVALLPSCEDTQVQWILDQETAGKNRVTITRAATKALEWRD